MTETTEILDVFDSSDTHETPDTLKREVFSIADFAKLSRTSRSTLLYYDKIGLLQPVSRHDNNYRYYFHSQIATVNLIRTCQELGMSLDEIKRLGGERTPEMVDGLLGRQIGQIDEEIDKWIRARKLLTTLKNIIHPMLEVDEYAITVEYVPAEPIVLGSINDYAGGESDYTAMAQFYKECENKYPDLNLNYPVWGMFSEERAKEGASSWPDRFYFYNPDGYDRKPAANYAIGYARGGYGQCAALHERVIAFIEANGYEICGPAYQEYPLNELCYQNDKDYLVRLMVTVRSK